MVFINIINGTDINLSVLFFGASVLRKFMSIVIASEKALISQWLDIFKKYAAEFDINPNDIEFWPDVKDKQKVEYLIVWKPPYDISRQMPNAKAIFNLGAGVDHLLLDDSLPADVPIVRVVDENLTKRMGEYVCLHSLHHLREMPVLKKAQANNEWREIYNPTAHEVTVGVMGLGEIGAYCAILLTKLGFNVIGWSNSPKNLENVKYYSGTAELDTFLAQTEILVNILPHTAKTDKLVTYKLLSKLNKNGALQGATYITAGRGKTHHQADLIRALQDGNLKSASLDVFETEPLNADSPLWGLDNVVITPHNASLTDHITVSKQILGQIRNHKNNGVLINVVDLKRGY